MNITLTGASGFIGKLLVQRLQAEGHQLHLLGRSQPSYANVKFAKWDALSNTKPPEEALANADAVIHLAGEPVGQRWSDEVKRNIRDSRINGTNRLVEALAKHPPKTLVAASAIGFYGDRGDEILTEASRPGSGFLPGVCVDWEQAAQAATALGTRVVNPRIGIVLGLGGGAIDQMLPIFRLGGGGHIGNGRQWMSWIHVEDLVALLCAALTDEKYKGPINGTSPNPVTNSEFTAALGHVLHRPAIIPVPTFGLKLMFGEMAEMLIGGQHVVPEAALKAGFSFRYPQLDAALQAIIKG